MDWSGRIIREDKRGAISNQRLKLLSVLGLDDDTWLSVASSFGKDYHGAVGSLAAYANNTGKRWIASKKSIVAILTNLFFITIKQVYSLAVASILHVYKTIIYLKLPFIFNFIYNCKINHFIFVIDLICY